MTDAATKLQQICDMKKDGLLSDEEFAAAKAKILAEPTEAVAVAPAVAVKSLSIDIVGTWKTTSSTSLGGDDSGWYTLDSGATLKIARDANGGLTAESTTAALTRTVCFCCPCSGKSDGHMTEKPRPLEVTDADHFEVENLWASGTNFFTIIDKDTLKTTNPYMLTGPGWMKPASEMMYTREVVYAPGSAAIERN